MNASSIDVIEENAVSYYIDLARWQGEPCAISTLLSARYSAGIYHVTTLPTFRSRGLGMVLTLTAMQTAEGCGFSSVVLSPRQTDTQTIRAWVLRPSSRLISMPGAASKSPPFPLRAISCAIPDMTSKLSIMQEYNDSAFRIIRMKR
jgi:hypothetical protein